MVAQLLLKAALPLAEMIAIVLQGPGSLFTEKTPSYGYRIPIVNLRRSDNRLRFIMGILVPLRQCFLSEYKPGVSDVNLNHIDK